MMLYLVLLILFFKTTLGSYIGQEPSGAYFGQITALDKIRITIYLMCFFSDLIRRHVYSRIDFKFLVPGHTYGPTDRNFAVIFYRKVRF